MVVSPARAPIGGALVHPCSVIFWYGSDYADGPATVVVAAKRGLRVFDLSGAYMQFGVNANFSGAPLAAHHSDGSLSLVEPSR